MSRRIRRYMRLSEGREELEAEDEIAYHLARKIEDLTRSGMTPESARVEADRQFGNASRVRSELRQIDQARIREARRSDFVDGLRQDVLYALRQLRMSPLFAAVAITTLALGISATVSIFSVLNAVLLRPLPYDGAERIVTIAESDDPSSRDAAGTTSFVLFEDLAKQTSTLEAVAVFDGWSPTVTGAGEAERLRGSFVTSGIFDVFRIRPELGRVMLPEDNVVGAPPRAWISWDMWQSRFAGDRAILGRALLLNDRSFEITGVLPRGFVPPGEEMWNDVWGNNYRDDNDTRGSRYLNVVARMKPGVTLEQTRSELRRFSAQLAQDYPLDNAGRHTLAFPLRDLVVGGGTRGPMLLLMIAAAVVLLIACANVSNLLLARGAARGRELSVRLALGTTRRRLIRQLVTESIVLGVIGTALALPLAVAVMRFLVELAPEGVRSQPIAMDGTV
ncbi:MAG TPA: ABC transporter permease, partial [Longimicrobiales bacterium]